MFILQSHCFSVFVIPLVSLVSYDLNLTWIKHSYKVKQTHQTSKGHNKHHINARQTGLILHPESVSLNYPTLKLAKQR